MAGKEDIGSIVGSDVHEGLPGSVDVSKTVVPKAKKPRKVYVRTRAQKDAHNAYQRGWRKRANKKNPARKAAENARLKVIIVVACYFTFCYRANRQNNNNRGSYRPLSKKCPVSDAQVDLIVPIL